MNNGLVCEGMSYVDGSLVPLNPAETISLGFVKLMDEDDLGKTEFKYWEETVLGFCEKYMAEKNNDKGFCCQAQTNIYSDESAMENNIIVTIVKQETLGKELEPVLKAPVAGEANTHVNITFSAFLMDSACQLSAVAFISSLILMIQ